jgi:hypothetical protein
MTFSSSREIRQKCILAEQLLLEFCSDLQFSPTFVRPAMGSRKIILALSIESWNTKVSREKMR